MKYLDLQIISNDKNLKITEHKNAKFVLLNVLKYKNYSDMRECIYDLYGTVIFNSISTNHRRKILYEYFKTKKMEEMKFIISKMNPSIDNMELFSLELSKLEYQTNINNWELFEYYMVNKSEDYKKFKDNVYKQGLNYKKPFEEISQVPYFSIEAYYIYLREEERYLGCNSIEQTVVEFYYFIQDLYYDGKIFLNMKYKDISYAFKDCEMFQILRRSKYNPIDIYYYFMKQLENRLNLLDIEDPTVSEIDKNAIRKYHNYIEETKEEGEI